VEDKWHDQCSETESYASKMLSVDSTGCILEALRSSRCRGVREFWCSSDTVMWSDVWWRGKKCRWSRSWQPKASRPPRNLGSDWVPLAAISVCGLSAASGDIDNNFPHHHPQWLVSHSEWCLPAWLYCTSHSRIDPAVCQVDRFVFRPWPWVFLLAGEKATHWARMNSLRDPTFEVRVMEDLLDILVSC